MVWQDIHSAGKPFENKTNIPKTYFTLSGSKQDKGKEDEKKHCQIEIRGKTEEVAEERADETH